ncbi:hypothetical protein PSENEW3n2_00005129 [Picochlorum sp. SENEW3]|nr:hypothetical protein PSENEW3n2_00005129 [Picochlorum sp. SENEW3]WPT17124.1 hypothetical protein PSENEW3_00005129 [Picochlorum sp. SENEW3]
MEAFGVVDEEQQQVECEATFIRQNVLSGLPVHSNPATLDEYDPITLSYYTGEVLSSSWPSLVGLCVFGVLLVGFILWRSLRWCCSCMRRRKHAIHMHASPYNTPYYHGGGSSSSSHQFGGVKDVCGAKGRRHGRSVGQRALLIGETIMALGILGSSIYGIVSVNHGVVSQGVAVVVSGVEYVESVIDTAQRGVDRARALGVSLEDIQRQLQGSTVIMSTRESGVLGIEEDLACLEPYVDQLPRRVSPDVSAVVKNADGVVTALYQDVQDIQSILKAQDGREESAVDTLLSAPDVLRALQTQLTEAGDLGTNLPLTGSDAIVSALKDVLDPLITSWDAREEFLGHVASDIDLLSTTVRDLAGRLPEDLEQARTLLSSEDVVRLSELYSSQRRAFVEYRPCLDGAVSQAQVLLGQRNDVTQEVRDLVATLTDAREDLYSVFGEGDQFDAIVEDVRGQIDDVGPVVDALVQFRDDLNSKQEFENLDSVVQSIRASKGFLEVAKPQVLGLLSQINSYEEVPSAQVYSQIVASARVLGTAALAASQQIDSLLSDITPFIDEAAVVNDQVRGIDIDRYLDEVERLYGVVQDGEIVRRMDAYDAAIGTLPDPPSSAFNSVNMYMQSAIDDVSSTLSSIQSELDSIVQTSQDGITQAQEEIVDTVYENIDKYEPQAQTYNTLRAAIMYVLFGLCIFFSLVIIVAAFLTWPALHSLSIFLFLCLMVVNYALVVAHTVGIKVGSDTCENLEPYILQQVDDAGAQQILQYYFNGGQGDVRDVVDASLGINVDDIIQTINNAKADVLAEIQGVSLSVPVETQVNASLGLADDIISDINAVVSLLEYEQAYPEYLEIRGFVCCDTIDMVGDLWLAMVLTGGFAFILKLFAFVLVHQFDALVLARWFERYKPT